MFAKRQELQRHIRSLQDDLDAEISTIRGMRDCQTAAARAIYLKQVRHVHHSISTNIDPNDPCISSAHEAFCVATKAAIAECDLKVQEAIRTLQPCLDELQCQLAGIDSSCVFTVNIYSLAGDCKQVSNLHMGDSLLSLYDKIAEKFGIPSFAVRVCFDGQLLDADSATKTLSELGMSEDCDVMLMQVWGWAKPRLDLLEQLEKQWTRGQGGTQCGVPSIPALERRPSATA